ncbi:S-adenosyl-L-methionine-dependent methyltransferase [Rhizoclosmatium globosum]|uniref:S-adenosyl-L-methionine-dependent methyltransferase n=1 Tax=Rhizoclosmatium globosum TaxID=329046 RepID=A0A1Y2D338_9FUNG|nr:S-adenosyl-L-methionine-dependent methyltransferase [Rhizoclosmatium globosum]|eukprot:ORY53627.1 S-adenosyl-L-methionine-dependent methyltransferase [Rhizoclosmatium globosum]
MTDNSNIKADFWEAAWTNNRTGWDLGGPTPALLSLLRSHQSDLFPSQQEAFTVLIPGVGRGYDVVAFAAKPGVKAIGWISAKPLGVTEAKKELARANLSTDRAEVILADFFEYTSAPFNVVFDHTFLCAIHPSLRKQWGAKMAELTKKDGYLICYMFPLREPDENGPPYALSIELYLELLGESFERVLQRDLEVSELPTSGMDRDKLGKQMISLWKRR